MTKTLLKLFARRAQPVELDPTALAAAALNARMQRMLAHANESQARASLSSGFGSTA